MHTLKQNHGLTLLTKCVIFRGENVNQIEAAVVETCSCGIQLNEYLRAERLGPRPVAAGIF
jgi:nitrous oxidase accessory protein NosD